MKIRILPVVSIETVVVTVVVVLVDDLVVAEEVVVVAGDVETSTVVMASEAVERTVVFGGAEVAWPSINSNDVMQQPHDDVIVS